MIEETTVPSCIDPVHEVILLLTDYCIKPDFIPIRTDVLRPPGLEWGEESLEEGEEAGLGQVCEIAAIPDAFGG